jgi:stress response protein YsnF
MSDYTSSYQSGTSSDSVLTAFFDNRADAENAIAQLRGLGLPEAATRLTEGAAQQATSTERTEDRGFFEKLGDFFMPDEDRHVYAEGLSRGGYLLTVSGIPAGQQDRVLDVLENAGAADIDEREAAWRAEGWSGYSGGQAQGYGATEASAGTTGYSGARAASAEGESIPVVEEQLRVGKRDVSQGRVRVRSYVRETPVEEQVSLSSENVEVERHPVDRAVTPADENAFQERTLEAEEHAEEAIVAKEARVVEEVNLRRDREAHQETVSDTVRHTEVEVEDDRRDPALSTETERRR